MSNSLKIENVLVQVRAVLNTDKIKLWLLPFYHEELGSVESEIEKLAESFSQRLCLPKTHCFAALTELQTSAIEKLRAKKEFQETGTATIKVRIPDQPGGTNLITIQIKLNETGNDLKIKLAKEIQQANAEIKFISSGRVIDNSRPLDVQGVANNHQLLALILGSTPDEATNENLIYDHVKNVKADAEKLMQHRSSFMQMEDQSGNAIHLPPSVEKRLMMALAMHEKGKAALNKEKYNEALVFFLDADQEYSQCEKQWLDAVDNYALLNLDIVWCYLCLKSVMQLPDAERRLQICEKNLHASYGEDMGRVEALKGSSGNEKALIMRLHLLQAIVLFHQNRRHEADELLRLADSELQRLQINDDSLTALVEMGYSVVESRIALRACGGEVLNAANYIMEKREKRATARSAGKKERDLERLIQGSSNQNDEDWINPRNLHVLTKMGYSKTLCAIALRKTKNDIAGAITLLNDNQDELRKELTVSQSRIDEMVSMGFDPELSKMLLTATLDNMDEAVAQLLKLQQEDGATFEKAVENLRATFGTAVNDGAGPSTSAGGTLPPLPLPLNSKLEEMKNDVAERKKAFERFAEDIHDDDEDKYLDLPLHQEEAILNEYKKLLNI